MSNVVVKKKKRSNFTVKAVSKEDEAELEALFYQKQQDQPVFNRKRGSHGENDARKILKNARKRTRRGVVYTTGRQSSSDTTNSDHDVRMSQRNTNSSVQFSVHSSDCSSDAAMMPPPSSTTTKGAKQTKMVDEENNELIGASSTTVPQGSKASPRRRRRSREASIIHVPNRGDTVVFNQKRSVSPSRLKKLASSVDPMSSALMSSSLTSINPPSVPDHPASTPIGHPFSAPVTRTSSRSKVRRGPRTSGEYVGLSHSDAVKHVDGSSSSTSSGSGGSRRRRRRRKKKHSLMASGQSISAPSQTPTISLKKLHRLATSPVFPELRGEYIPIECVGQGSFSRVWKVRRVSDGKYFAIKRLFPIVKSHKVTGEIKHLTMLSGEKNITQMVRVLRHRGQISLVLTTQKTTNIRDFVRRIDFKGMQSYCRGLLIALAGIHKYGLIHRDVKPSNFLYDEKTGASMLIDFGLAETVDASASRTSNPSRAGTRGFRPPEVLMKSIVQTTAIDIWAVGVILLAMITKRYPFFRSDIDIIGLAEIATLIGTKQITELGAKLGKVIHFSFEREGSTWKQICEHVHPEIKGKVPKDCYNLLDKLLHPNPLYRITAQDALKHSFLKKTFK